MDERVRTFLEQNHAAAMITLRRDGTPHAVRVAVALVDGKIWSSGTQTRLRTKHLLRDPRSTLFVYDTGFRYLGIEATVTIFEGPDVPQISLRLFQALQQQLPTQPKPGYVIWGGQEKTIEEFLHLMVEEQRIIYEFNVARTYGMY